MALPAILNLAKNGGAAVSTVAKKGLKQGVIDLAKKTPGFLMKASGADRVPILQGAYDMASRKIGDVGDEFSQRRQESVRPSSDEGLGHSVSKRRAEDKERELEKAHDDAKAEAASAKSQSTLEAIAKDIAVIKENTAGGVGGQGSTEEKEQGGFLSNLGGIISGVFTSGIALLGTKFGGFLKPFQGMIEGLKGVLTKVTGIISSVGSKLAGLVGSLKGKVDAIVTGAKNLVSRGAAAASSLVQKAVNTGRGVVSKAATLGSGAVSAAGRLWDSAKGLVMSQGAKAGGRTIAKKIPVVGALAGLGFAGQRAWEGDWSGAGLEVASGLASTIPGLGTAASFGIDAGLAVRDGVAESENGSEIAPVPTPEQSVAQTPPKVPQTDREAPESTIDPEPMVTPTPAIREARLASREHEQARAEVNKDRESFGIFGFMSKLLERLSAFVEAGLNENVGIFTRPAEDTLSMDNFWFQNASADSPKRPEKERPESDRSSIEPIPLASPAESVAQVGAPDLSWTADSGSKIDAGMPVSSSSEYAPLLDMIASGESAGAGDYDAVWNGSRVQPDKPLSEMTIAEVKAWQKATLNEQKGRGIPQDRRSSAAGRYQFISGTLASTQERLGVKDDELFNAEMQDRFALNLLDSDKRRGLSAYKSGKASASDFQDFIASQWASVQNSDGRGVYDVPGFNSAHTNSGAALSAIESVRLTPEPSANARLVNASVEQNQPIVVPMPSAPSQQQTMSPRAAGPSSGANNTPSVAMVSRNPDGPIRKLSEGFMLGTV